MNDVTIRALSGLLDYLLARGWVDPESVILGDYQVVLRESRNRSFAVTRRTKASLLVKVPKSADGKRTLLRETLFYRAVHANPDLASIRQWIPGFIESEDDDGVLAIELIQDALNLADLRRDSGEIPTGALVRLGTALGTIRGTTSVGHGRCLAGVVQADIPWVLRVVDGSFGLEKEREQATGKVVQWVRESETLVHGLARGRQLWISEGLVHGDMKLHNCISSRDVERVVLIDWELASLGDCLWDAASAMQSLWVNELLLGNHSDTEAARAACADAGEAFWTAYFDSSHISGTDRRLAIDRARIYSACRMVQTAYELSQAQARIPVPAMSLLRTAASDLQFGRGGGK